MRFKWDEAKNRINIRKHGFDFAVSPALFESRPFVMKLDDRFDYGEDRWQGIGEVKGRVAVVIFTFPEDDVIRIISIRKADSHERKEYEKAIREGG